MIYNDFCGPGLELKIFTHIGPKKKIEESTSQICLSACAASHHREGNACVPFQ
jgi:hypothetical protein